MAIVWLGHGAALIQTYHGPEHVTFYNTGEEQVEMHLRANRPILVEICQLDLQVRMNEGETINTEICGKFSRQSAATMAEEAGLRVNRWFYGSSRLVFSCRTCQDGSGLTGKSII